MIRIFILNIFLITVSLNLYAQLGGQFTYAFLDLSYSARSAALGGRMIPVLDRDVALAVNNPSLLNPQMHNHFHIGVSDYLSDVIVGNASYARKLNDKYMSLGSIKYLDYGDFIKSDEFGNITGGFHASEYAINFALSRILNKNIYIGSGLSFIYSTFESYNSFGISTDYAISYHNEDKILTASFVINNLGFQLKPYSDNNREPLPLNIQLGISKKLEHMPLRFIIVAHHLNDLDFTYKDPNKNNINSFDNSIEQNAEEIPFSEKFFRHFNFSGEMVFSPNFHVRFGYNHQRRKELQISGRPGMVGYSFGFGIRINKFLISYGNATYHVGGRTNTFSITTNFSEFIRKKEVVSPIP